MKTVLHVKSFNNASIAVVETEVRENEVCESVISTVVYQCR